MYNNKKGSSRWLMAAMAAPLTQAASNCSWITALIVAVSCLAVTKGLCKLEVGLPQTRFLAAVQWLWMLLVISEFLHWTMLYWPNHKNYYAVPLTILALAANAAAQGWEIVKRSSGILYWILTALFGVILLSGMKEVKLENITFQWQMQTAYLVVVLLIPAVGASLERIDGKAILIYTVITAFVTMGVLSAGMVSRYHAPFYEMSRSISILSFGRRFESLVAAGMTLGYYTLMTYFLTLAANNWEKGRRIKRGIWISCIFSALIFLSGMRLNSRLLAVGCIAIWVVFPGLEKILKKSKISLDKNGMTW